MAENKTRPWLVITLSVVILVLLAPFCVTKADAADIEEPAPLVKETFAVELTPVSDTALATARSTTGRHRHGQCYGWTYGPWREYDGIGRLKWGTGRNDILCLNRRGTRWATIVEFHPTHFTGYWRYEWTKKHHSKLGYASLILDDTQRFTWNVPIQGGEIAHRDVSLNCDVTARNHTAYCTRYH